MSSISDLKDELTDQANELDDTLDQLECLADIDSWYNARVAIDALSASDVLSYTINGRSVTRKSLPDLRRTERDLYERVMAKLRCHGVAFIDSRYPIDSNRQGVQA